MGFILATLAAFFGLFLIGLGIIVYVLVCVFLGIASKRLGRSFAGYFCLSFFLTPLVGFAAFAFLLAKCLSEANAESAQTKTIALEVSQRLEGLHAHLST